MASGILRNAVPAHLFLFELLAGSSVIGLTTSRSSIRTLMLPVITASVYGVIRTIVRLTGPRHAGLVGGFSFLLLLRYVDAALITRWDFGTHGPTRDVSPKREKNAGRADIPKQNEERTALRETSYWGRFTWGWNTLWSFRQVNTPHEVRNTPPFSRSDPNYIPSRWTFVAQKLAVSACCYLVLDVLGQQAPPKDASIFNPALIPFFRRIGEVTWDQVKLRALSIAMFGITFYSITQGAYSISAATGVAAGLSNPSSWRPAFGSILDAYSLRNFWGKVWHQFMRRLLSAPASYIVHKVLGLDADSVLVGSVSTLLAFALSGVMHMAAQHSSGAPLNDTSVLHFFVTQGLGVTLEVYIDKLLQSRRSGRSEGNAAQPSLTRRFLGYGWVIAFLAWSGPVWLYPGAFQQAVRQSSGSFVPYSVITAWRS